MRRRGIDILLRPLAGGPGHSYEIGDLYSIGVDGKGLRRLTDNKAIETSPAWDPSGNRIAYIEANPDHSFTSDLANIFPAPLGC